ARSPRQRRGVGGVLQLGPCRHDLGHVDPEGDEAEHQDHEERGPDDDDATLVALALLAGGVHANSCRLRPVPTASASRWAAPAGTKPPTPPAPARPPPAGRGPPSRCACW